MLSEQEKISDFYPPTMPTATKKEKKKLRQVPSELSVEQLGDEDGVKNSEDTCDDSTILPKAKKSKKAKIVGESSTSTATTADETLEQDATSKPATKKAALKTKKNVSKPVVDEEEDTEGAVITAAPSVRPQPRVDAVESMNTVPVSNFKISKGTVEALKNRGIEDLFPIQAATFETIMAGKDLIARARTGQGKTLAFCLPILEQLIAKGLLNKGVNPKTIIMSPTRELAKQILTEFATLCPGLRIEAIYGGVSLQDNYSVLRKGIDVIVGTPGRIKDLLDRGWLKFDNTDYVVLDEADQMLDMGFQDEIGAIFDAVKDHPKQVLLFSATMPAWVHNIADKYLSLDRKVIDLVGDSKIKAVTSVRHIAMPAHWQLVGSIVNDIIAMFTSREGKVLVFCGTKLDCDTIVMDKAIKHECHVLHGDIPQAKRESTLTAYKNGNFRVLVATDVAARGLDLFVDLVINVKPPIRLSGNADTETYVHRSGRTGRAGRSGVCVT